MVTHSKFRVLSLVSCTLLASQIALAYVEVSPMVLKLDGKSNSISITNVGDHPEYITLNLYQVDNPGSDIDNEKRTDLASQKNPDLFVMPTKISLGPKQTKIAHLNVIRKPDREKVYRLVIKPLVNSQPNSYSMKNDMVINVNLGYENIIRHMPVKQIATWTHECTFNGLKLIATGTVRVEFSDLVQNKSVLQNFNLYPDHPLYIPYKSLSGVATNKKFQINC